MLVNLSKDQMQSLIILLEERIDDIDDNFDDVTPIHLRGELQEIANKLQGIIAACTCKEQNED
tara:strand:- start:35 stop:223 length:189 start_codon:yes stop_codon:yes gene_type:complete